MVDSLQEHYVGYCPLSKGYLIFPTFRELALLPSSGEWLQFVFVLVVITVGIKAETFRMRCSLAL
jgi:hypothetical protein